MKKNKIIGALVGAFGVAISVGTAIALYTKPVNALELGIGSATHTSSTSTVAYKINGAVSPTVDPAYYTSDAAHNSGHALGEQGANGTYVCAKYEYALGATFAEDIQAQDYLVGNLSVSLTNVNASLQNKVQVSMYFDGYVADSLGAHYYGSNLTSNSTVINETVISASSLTVDSRDICVSSNGTQKLVIFFELLDTVDYLAMDEANNLWSLSVSWGAPSNAFESAYIASTKTLWGFDDEFVMAPNINKAYSEGWEWTAQIKGSEQLTQAKCRIGSEDWGWALGDNAELANGTVYDVYWHGVDTEGETHTSSYASFTARS